MRNHEMAAGLTMHWVSVADSRGRTHMEARWDTGETEPRSSSSAQAVHAA